MNFADKLKKLRKEKGLSQEQLAEKCNVSRQAISKWELGQGYPETERLLILCELFGVDLNYLLLNKKIEPNRSNNNFSYNQFLGKWVNILLNDRHLSLINVAVLAMDDHFIMYNYKKKNGIIEIKHIKTITQEYISKSKINRAVQLFNEGTLFYKKSAYELLMGKPCLIRLKNNDLFPTFLAYTNIFIISIIDNEMIISKDGKQSIIKLSDILTILEI